MKRNYTNETDIQIVIALLKKHGIKRIVISPGTTNHTFVLSVQNDSFFELYSCVDERSAAYMACGIASESGEPVVLSCTAATASRNYFPALTEAFYRKLPILAITSTRTTCQVGNLIDQQIDRSIQPKDTVKLSVNLPYIKDEEDFWECELKTNKAILELNHHGKGPVHINMPTRYDHNFDCEKLPDVRCIKRYSYEDVFPDIPQNAKIGIFIGSHEYMTSELVNAIDEFCENNNAVVFYEHTSGYHGKYGVLFYLALCQQNALFKDYLPDLVIDIGEIAALSRIKGKKLWRISEDGEIKDPWKNLEYIFEMNEKYFFNSYSKKLKNKKTSYYEDCKKHIDTIRSIPFEVPFSNVFVAKTLSRCIPENSELHFGILNSLRSWNLFLLPQNIKCISNTGGYGIDGCVSTLIGASFVNPKKLYFGFFGDLSFFYDMNSLGNRHLSNNVRILLVNNGLGEEFKLFFNPAFQWENEVNKYVAAEGHFGKQSKYLVKHYVEDLGFEYLSASDIAEFEKNYRRFVVPEMTDKPIFFEVFTSDTDENQAIKTIMNIYNTKAGKIKNLIKSNLSEKRINDIKKILKK